MLAPSMAPTGNAAMSKSRRQSMVMPKWSGAACLHWNTSMPQCLQK